MTEIISVITDNLVWILVGIVIILLAIIGRYADKTNFGEGKKVIKVKKKKNEKDLIDELEVETREEKQENNSNSEGIDIIEEMKNNTKDNFGAESNEEVLQTEVQKPKENQKTPDEMSLDEFMKTDDLDVLLPKKNVIAGDFLQEVEDINLDFNKKDEFSNIPDLDDVELPSIKKKNSNSESNIWN